MIKLKQKIQIDEDLGFGKIPTSNNQRVLNRDGSSNIIRLGLPRFRTHEAYNSLIAMSWIKFWIMIFAAYLIINTFFALIYVSLGIENLEGTRGTTQIGFFFDAFFFSAQTISTVGYGHISPKGFATSAVAAFESMMGLLAFAMATGLLYGRFSKPSAKILYSKNLLVAPYLNGKAFMFRLANLRSNNLTEIEVQVLLAINADENGKKIRRFVQLELERSKIALMSLSWTIVHPLDDKSPLYNISKTQLKDSDAEFIILIKAFDDTFSQTVHSRTSYKPDEIVWDAKFVSIIGKDENGVSTLNYAGIHDYEKAKTEELVAS